MPRSRSCQRQLSRGLFDTTRRRDTYPGQEKRAAVVELTGGRTLLCSCSSAFKCKRHQAVLVMAKCRKGYLGPIHMIRRSVSSTRECGLPMRFVSDAAVFRLRSARELQRFNFQGIIYRRQRDEHRTREKLLNSVRI